MTFGITQDEIRTEELRASVLDQACGACVVFEGWIRNHTVGRAVSGLEYEVYRPLAMSEGSRVLGEALAQFDIENAGCIHREGRLQLGETAVVAIAVAKHRDEAFRACRYIIDEVKHRLPIWKKEHYTDGDSHWVNCMHCAGHGSAQPPGEGRDG